MNYSSKPSETLHGEVRNYYGKVVQKTDDLKLNVCNINEKTKMPKHVREAIKLVHEEVKNKYYGCGLTIPDAVQDTAVLDLGSGAGLDCFALSKLVGEKGFVTGVDMTPEQLAVARSYIQYHMEKFEYANPNVEFLEGFIEKIHEAGAKENFYDIIISNCVINLSTNKKAVLEGAYKALKVGGELYFSDVYADRKVPEEIRKHEVLWGECIAGALYWQDLYSIAEEVGFSRPRLVSAGSFPITQPELKQVIGDCKFLSAEYRLFKLPLTREQPCTATYLGGILEHAESWMLDINNTFMSNKSQRINEEVATILKTSRFAKEFKFGSAECKEESAVNPFLYCELNNSRSVCCDESQTNGCGQKAVKPLCCAAQKPTCCT